MSSGISPNRIETPRGQYISSGNNANSSDPNASLRPHLSESAWKKLNSGDGGKIFVLFVLLPPLWLLIIYLLCLAIKALYRGRFILSSYSPEKNLHPIYRSIQLTRLRCCVILLLRAQVLRLSIPWSSSPFVETLHICVVTVAVFDISDPVVVVVVVVVVVAAAAELRFVYTICATHSIIQSQPYPQLKLKQSCYLLSDFT